MIDRSLYMVLLLESPDTPAVLYTAVSCCVLHECCALPCCVDNVLGSTHVRNHGTMFSLVKTLS